MKKYLLLFAAVLSIGLCYSQKKSSASAILDSYAKTHYEEKLFVHVNGTFFLTGESLMFKAYCLNAADNTISDLSKVAYVELIGADKTPALQTKIQLKDGSGYGDFFLPSSLASGNYTMIGYTNWMKNYSQHSFFQIQITVINPFKKPTVSNITGNQKADVRFYPEGGSMVAGVKNVMGFRGTRADKKTLKFSGKVIDEGGQTVAEFNSSSNGTGKFPITPAAGHQYKAVIMDSAQNVLFVNLPKASTEGMAMETTATATGYHVTLTNKTPGKEVAMKLLLHQRGVPLYESEVRFTNGFAEVDVANANVPAGISQITIINSADVVECDRLIWKAPTNGNKLKISAGNKNYRLREYVALTLSTKDTSVLSHLSVSVRKVDPELVKAPGISQFVFGLGSDLQVNNDGLISGEDLLYKFDLPTDADSKTEKFLPEVRGNLITGKLLDANGKLKPKEPVYMSVPAKNYLFYASKTDSTGRFYFNTDGIPTTSNLVLTVNTKSCPDCKVTIDRSDLEDYSAFTPQPLLIDSAFKKVIERRSVLSQIENAYYIQKQDSITPSSTERFYGRPDKLYVLDDYVRFPTMEDVFIEYITEVIVKKSADQFELKAMNFVTRQSFQDDPLVLLDGVPMFDTERIMNYNPLTLQKIEVVGRRYFYGPLDVQGIISLSTYDGEATNISLPEKFKFTGIQPRKRYYSPDYRIRTLDKIPDYRVQLYWNPEVTVSTRTVNLGFFTSDIPGDYEIVAEGMQSDGTPIYYREVIRVKN